MRYVTLAIPIIILAILMMPYSTLAEIWDSGYDSEISLDRSGVDDSYLIIGRSGVGDTYFVMAPGSSIVPSTFQLTGYSYESILTFENDCADSYFGRFIVNDWPGAVLASGGYIQADGDDIALTYEGSNEKQVTAMVGTGGNTLICDYYDLPANSVLTGHLYMGNSSISRDQWWIADASDITYADDDNSLDITTDLEISTDIYIPFNPDSEQVIISKAGAYEVLVDSTPAIVFRLYGSGGGAGYTASGNPSSVVSSTLLAN